MVERLTHYIGGERVAEANGRAGEVFNPATGDLSAADPPANAGAAMANRPMMAIACKEILSVRNIA